jgi:tRNA threonylcarbamoyladenosine biosynthesis protein TsaB
MRLLALDTSTETLSVALRCGGETLSRTEQAGAAASERALPLIALLLAEAGITGASLDAIAFGEGPGSFTGLRIACGITQGLAEAWALPVVPVSSFLAAAESARAKHGPAAARVVVAFDARMQEVYLGAFEQVDGIWRALQAPQVVAPAQARLSCGVGLLGCGDGFARYPDLQAAMAGALQGIDAAIAPSAVAMIGLAAIELAAGRAVDPSRAHPNYLRDKVALTVAERRARREGTAA